MPETLRGGSLKFGVLKLAIGLLALVIALAAWVAVLAGTDVDQGQQLQQTAARAGNLALVFEEQVYRQVLAIDQTLRILKLDWERNPSGFRLDGPEKRTASMSDFVTRLDIIDSRGRVVTGTDPSVFESDMSARRFFIAHRSNDYFGPLTTGPFQNNGSWYLNISRRLNGPLNTFGGVVVASYDLNALSRDMAQADLGPRGFIMLVGRDGLVRAVSLHGVYDVGANISETPLFHAVQTLPDTSWTGVSGVDKDMRLHAWRPIPNQDMILIVGIDRAAALAGSESRRQEAVLGASIVIGLVLVLAMAIGSMISAAAARETLLAQDRETLEAANRELARARERADQKSLQLGMTLAGMTDGISMFDGELRLVQWNSQFADLAGLPRDQLHVGMPLEDMLRIQARGGEFGSVDEDEEVNRLMAMMRSDTWPPVYVRRRPNGLVLEMRRTRLPDGGWVTMYSDITARQQAEDAQSRAREMAEIAAQEKSRFVAIVSHEIRTPLNVALNSLGLLDQSNLSGPQRQLVQTGLMAGEALMGLLNDILDLSRLQVGRLQLRPAPFQVRPLMQGVLELFRLQAEERGVHLSLHVAQNVPERLMTDAGRLRQAMMNLVNNAAKFADPGAASIRVNDATFNNETVLRFAVRDCGPDIPDLDRARLFRPFSQLERQGSGGTGLGLAICQLLANLLGGQIGCDPIPSGGKEFWLTLPQDVANAPPESVPAIAPPASAPNWLPRTRVLLVEDMPANQMIVATMLRREGHMVDVASSGLEALDMLAANTYDLALLDIFMPGIDGLETARRIRALPGPAGSLPLVALTANVSAADRAEFKAAGMIDLVPKPVERTALAAVLANHVWAGRRADVAVLPIQQHRPPPADTWAEPAIDLARVASLRNGLPPEVCDGLFADSIQQLRDMVSALDSALQLQDQLASKRVTHAMVGVAGNYGFAAIENLIKIVSARPPEEIDPLSVIQRVQFELDRVEQALRFLPEPRAA